jgi:hypothetical protein
MTEHRPASRLVTGLNDRLLRGRRPRFGRFVRGTRRLSRADRRRSTHGVLVLPLSMRAAAVAAIARGFIYQPIPEEYGKPEHRAVPLPFLFSPCSRYSAKFSEFAHSVHLSLGVY